MGGSILVLICCCLFGWRFVGKKKNAKEHGFGLVSIENVVKKYHGDMKHISTTDTFRLEITIWNV